MTAPPIASLTAPPRSMALDLLRIYACAWVVLLHWGFASHLVDRLPHALVRFTLFGNLGVDIFFILSGAVIIHSALRRPWQSFAFARFLRLFPAFLAAGVLVAIVLYLGIGRGFTLDTLLNLSGLNFWIGTGYISSPMWTLPLEVTFYAFVALAILLARNHLTPEHIRRFSYVYFVVYLLALAFGGPVMGIITINHVGPLFLWGALLAISPTRVEVQRNLPALFVAFVLSVDSERVRIASIPDSTTSETFGYALALPVVCGAVVLWATMRSGSAGRRPRLSAGVQTLALMTYPLYLMHDEMGEIVAGAVHGLGASYLVGWIAVGLLVLALSWCSVAWYEPWARRTLRRVFGR